MRILDWKEVSLGECVDLLTGFPFKSQQFTHNPNDISLVKGANVHQGYIDWDDAKRWSVSEYGKYEKFQLQTDDVVVAMDRPWIEAGLKYAWIRSNDPKCLLVQRVARLRGINGLLTSYLRYLIGSSDFTNYIKPIVTGVNVPHISADQIKGFKFFLPPVAVQQRIVDILSVYDRLIENNTRRIKILEEMARSLYDEWFVKFRFPGHEQTKLVDSELGLIPEDWTATTIGGGCLVGDGAHAKIKRQESGVMYLTCKNFKGGDLDLSRVDYISENDHNKYFRENSKALSKPKPGDILFSIIGTLGEPYLFKPEDSFGISSSVSILRPNSNSLSSIYLFYWIKNSIFQDALYGIKGGVAQSYVSLEMIKSLPLYYPEKSLQNSFDDHVLKILSLITVLTQKNKNLRQTRDFLLPKLISGEIDVEMLDASEEETVNLAA